MTDDFKMIGPLAYGGKKDCESVMCRRSGGRGRLDDGTWDFGECVGWHCSYCDEPTSYQGHNCDAAEAILGEARRQTMIGDTNGP